MRTSYVVYVIEVLCRGKLAFKAPYIHDNAWEVERFVAVIFFG
jgi:hypothetical protein